MDAGWRVVAVSAIGLAVSAGTLVVYCFAVFLKPLSQEFHWSRGDVSWALTAMNLVVTIGSPMVGKLTDRFGARAVVLPSIALLSGVLFSFYFLSPNLWLLYALYSLCGLFGVGATPVTYSRVVTTWFDQRRGLALGITTSGMGVGAFVMPLFAQWVIAGTGWRWAYVALGVAGLAIPLPLATLFLGEAPGRGTQRTDFDDSAGLPHTPGSPRPAAIRTAVFWRMTVSFFLLAACLNGTVTHLSALLTDAGSSPRSAAFSIALFGGATFAGRIITGLLVDYVFAPYVAGVLFGGAALAVSLLAIESTGNSGNAVAVLLGVGVGAEADVMLYLISRYFGIRALGELFGYVFGAYTLGVAVGPVVMGAGFDATGSYHLPLTTFALALLVAIVGTVTLPKYSTS